jgi:regulator of cell morphogenesis and NO signaling
VLFPRIRQLDAAADDAARDDAQLAELIELLKAEHETVGGLLEQLRHMTGGYTTPADGCASYAACYRALAELEADTHLHVHKENKRPAASLTGQSPRLGPRHSWAGRPLSCQLSV